MMARGCDKVVLGHGDRMPREEVTGECAAVVENLASVPLIPTRIPFDAARDITPVP
jgi:hypothetical protein